MCLVCVDMAKGSLTLIEAKRNLGEMNLNASIEDAKHYEEILVTIKEKEEMYEKFYQVYAEGAD